MCFDYGFGGCWEVLAYLYGWIGCMGYLLLLCMQCRSRTPKDIEDLPIWPTHMQGLKTLLCNYGGLFDDARAQVSGYCIADKGLLSMWMIDLWPIYTMNSLQAHLNIFVRVHDTFLQQHSQYIVSYIQSTGAIKLTGSYRSLICLISLIIVSLRL